MISTKQLRAATKEVVEILGLVDSKKKDIVITALTPVGELTKILTDVLDEELLTPDDNISEATQVVLDELREPGELPEEEEQIPKPEEEEEEEEVVEKIYQKNIGKKAINADKKTPVEDEPEEEEEEEIVLPKKTPKPKNTTGKTKKSIIEEMIGTKKGATVEEMAQRMVDEGIDADYKKNLVVTKLWLSKMGFATNKAAIEKTPNFKKK